jgi:DNA-binding response OmpR family regulator
MTRSHNGNAGRVLVVEDDEGIREMLKYNLSTAGFTVQEASDGASGLRSARTSRPDLILLDLMLPGMSGFDFCRALRKNSRVPIIMITAKDAEIDKIVGLELGADDYITKPFGLRELLARIRAVLRRREAGQAAVQRDQERGRCRFGGWQLDRRNRRLTDPNGIPVALTKGEYALLIAFLDAPQRPLSREHLLQATRIHEDVFDRSIDV